jgi:hypothetical protein
MNLIKKILLISIVAIWITSFWFTADFYYDYDIASTDAWNETEIGNIIQTDVIDNDNSSLNKLLDLFNLSNQSRYGNSDGWETSKAIYYAKMIVNMLLSLVSLIALVMLIFAFYMMFFSKQESGMTKAKQMLKWIALAITIMWLSWFIVSFIFWIQTWSSDTNGNNNINTSSSAMSTINTNSQY